MCVKLPWHMLRFLFNKRCGLTTKETAVDNGRYCPWYSLIYRSSDDATKTLIPLIGKERVKINVYNCDYI